jgi:hypothetical protein
VIGEEILSELMILLIAGLAALVLTLEDWRGWLLAWALMGAGGGWLLQQTPGVPGQLASIQVLTSALLALLLYLTGWQARKAAPKTLTSRPPVHWRFRAMAALFFHYLARILAARFPIPIAPAPILITTYTLIGIGLLIATLGRSPLQVGLGILTMFSGYGLFYFSVQDSLLAIGLMAGMNLVIAFLTAALTLVSQEASA